MSFMADLQSPSIHQPLPENGSRNVQIALDQALLLDMGFKNSKLYQANSSLGACVKDSDQIDTPSNPIEDREQLQLQLTSSTSVSSIVILI